ncbi:transcriptional regulator [Solimonas fluminis]|uniref:Transcriptional regulator n=1 Tax=Solimonas fluminis TaxID=2086571 RepID=A0A2S5TDS1_9GAMM|nr:helix-turn-helix transcriptional regulator [Solimonas fluminis]PPE73072.1 transcriptional regulator [Solimonas fluminis]
MQKRPDLIALGRKIRAVREDKGFSQEGFSVEVGLDRAYYGGIERGERNVAAVNLMKMAQALQVEVGELFPALDELAALSKRRTK